MKRTALIVAVLALLVPATALAATTDYRGKTKQGKKASARVVDGRLKMLKISWAVPCERGRWSDRTLWDDRPEGPIEHDGSKFTDGGTNEIEFKDGRAKYNLKLSGEFTDKRIRGKMSAKVKFYDTDGDLVDSCRGTVFFSLPRA